MTSDEIEVVIKVKMSVNTGGLFENPGPGLVPTDPKDWAPTSDPGWTLPDVDMQVREILLGKPLRTISKISFWEWLRCDYLARDVTVTEIVSVKTLSQSYLSGE